MLALRGCGELRSVENDEAVRGSELLEVSGADRRARVYVGESMSLEHPVWKKVTVPDALALLTAEGVALPSRDQLQEKFNWLSRKRQEKIHNERENPLLYGYRPSVWYVAMAVLGLDWMIPPTLFKQDGTRVEGGEAFGAAVRESFGMETPWDTLCILGGNRGTKTEFECYTGQASLYQFPKASVYMFHKTSKTSIKIHQTRMYSYLMPGDRVTSRSTTTYISYKQKTGFSDGSGYILPNKSECIFMNYMQELDSIEGAEPGDPGRGRCVGYAADELVPIDLINTLDLRLAQFNSCGVIGFTPVDGYTPTVARFVEGAKVLRYGKAFLVPRDGGEPDTELSFAHEDCLEWFGAANAAKPETGDLKLETGNVKPESFHQVESLKSLPASLVNAKKPVCDHPVEDASTGQVTTRVFHATPRVLQSASKTDGMICFFTDDNPFVVKADVWKKICDKSEEKILERYYGWTNRRMAGAFPLFDEDVHTINPEAIPTRGTNYMITDPSKNRNYPGLWVRVTPDEIFVYREWPSQVEAIPGQGFIGPWALPSDSAKKYDGKKGPGQNNFGWGLCQYKQEFARIEGWECYKADASFDEIKTWRENGPAKEKINMRLLDARFGNVKGMDEGGQLNLFDQFDQIGLTFYESESGSRTSIEDGCILINDALAYDTNRPVDFTNRPTVRISTDCLNLIFAMKIYTGIDGQTGACKDFIDCLRMFFLKGVSYVDQTRVGIRGGGGCY